MTSPTWETEALKCRVILANSIPKEFELPATELPPKDQLNVLNVPAESGRLSVRELQITESDGTHLVSELAAGNWTAEEVTLAYLKRATIGQQLVE